MPSLRSTSSGCGSTANSYPALSRLFVEHIDPCCNDCNLTLGDDNLVVDTKFDRVGINTSNPVEALDVNGNIIASGNVSATTMDVSNGTSPGLLALNVTGDVDINGDLDVNGTSTFTGNVNLSGGNLIVESDLIKTNITTGMVGINNANPTKELDVIGDIRGTRTMTVPRYITTSMCVAILRPTTTQSVPNITNTIVINWNKVVSQYTQNASVDATTITMSSNNTNLLQGTFSTGIFKNISTTNLIVSASPTIRYADSAAGFRICEILVSSTSSGTPDIIVGGARHNTVTGVPCYITSSATFLLQPNYQFAIKAYQNSGGALNINNGADTAFDQTTLALSVTS